ncbi:hypothetical protein PAHAL_6G057100 [Panicum hallii]|uniref:Uncharacterized protein n=1 Tax=Panicum hallii TaxID=206008 RepID=A0A2T8IFE0_9POAL|nr:hypothetical protein PAHAL_6G057100 [Panicum hallii]
MHLHQLSTITGYRLCPVTRMSHNSKTKTSQDESRHPYTSSTLMSTKGGIAETLAPAVPALHQESKNFVHK